MKTRRCGSPPCSRARRSSRRRAAARPPRTAPATASDRRAHRGPGQRGPGRAARPRPARPRERAAQRRAHAVALLRLGRRRDRRLPEGARRRSSPRTRTSRSTSSSSRSATSSTSGRPTSSRAAGPDMYIAPNDNLFSQADAGALADLTTQLDGQARGLQRGRGRGLQGRRQVLHGPRVPQGRRPVVRQVARSPTAPATTDDAPRRRQGRLDQARPEPGRVPQFGFTRRLRRHAHGRHRQVRRRPGRLRRRVQVPRRTSRPPARSSTPTATPSSRTSRPASSTPIVDGPWQTADFTHGPRRQPRRRADPRPAPRKANPLTGTDGWYINPNSREHRPRGRSSPSRWSAPRSEQVLTDRRRPRPRGARRHDQQPHRPGLRRRRGRRASPGRRAPSSTTTGAPSATRSTRSSTRAPMPTAAVATACKTMNEANGK